jgi:hypothetical protein
MSAYVAHSDGRDFDGRPSLSGYCGRGSTYNLPGGHDWRTAIAGWHAPSKKGLAPAQAQRDHSSRYGRRLSS